MAVNTSSRNRIKAIIQRFPKSGNPYTRGAFRGTGKSGAPYLLLASCPGDYAPGKEYDVNVAFSPNGNYILPY